MAYICDHCGKGVMVGKQHKHHPGVAGGRWKKRAPKTPKTFRPNLHAAHIVENGTSKSVRLCTKCLRIAKASMKPAVEVKQEESSSILTA